MASRLIPASRDLVILCLLVRPLAAADERPLVTHAVLVHGIWESGKYTFVDLRSRLKASGVKVLVPRLRPATADLRRWRPA